MFFVLMDACHMLKLAHNMLQAYSLITNTTGEISWSYIVELNNVQTKDGLHVANEITNKHVHFDDQKVKVSLAAQTETLCSGSTVHTEGPWLFTV